MGKLPRRSGRRSRSGCYRSDWRAQPVPRVAHGRPARRAERRHDYGQAQVPCIATKGAYGAPALAAGAILGGLVPAGDTRTKSGEYARRCHLEHFA